MTCRCGREAYDQRGRYACIGCGIHCLFCDCPTPTDTPVPDRREPMPDGLSLWSDQRAVIHWKAYVGIVRLDGDICHVP